jgi:hypothetical protein
VLDFDAPNTPRARTIEKKSFLFDYLCIMRAPNLLPREVAMFLDRRPG